MRKSYNLEMDDERDALLAPPDTSLARKRLSQDVGLGKEPSAANSNTVRLGLLYYATSTVFFSLMAATVKLGGHAGIPSFQILFFRSIILLIMTIPMTFHTGENPLGNRRWLLCLRGTFGFGSISSLYFALQLIPLADMTVFTFLAPIIIAILSPYMLGETLVEGTWATCTACMVAVVLVAQPSLLFGHRRLPLAGVLVALLHPLFSALAKGCVRLLCATESTNTIMFYMAIFSTGCSVLGMCLPGQYVRLSSWYQVLLLMLTGLFGYGAQLFMNMGLRRVKAAQGMSMAYLGIVWSSLVGFLVFKEYPNLFAALGMLVIVTSTLLFGLKSSGYWTSSSSSSSSSSAA